MINNDLNIYVLQHKPYINRHKDLENRIPLQVGALDKPKFCDICDCYGDNISNKNKTAVDISQQLSHIQFKLPFNCPLLNVFKTDTNVLDSDDLHNCCAFEAHV